MYVARDADGKQVALKELAFVQAPTLAAIAAFEREAKFLRALAHPAIPRFVASFEEGAGVHVRYYLAQELVTGESLDARLAEHWFTEAEIIQIAREVLGVLVYLQGLSPMVIHRDIKPANLIARADGSIAVVDFGAAHVQGTTAGSTSVGTFGYMPVEQLAGLVDATTDPYALGASLLHLLTRREPWRILQGLDFGQVNVSPALRAFLTKLVAAEPGDRYANATAALEALERAARGELPEEAAAAAATSAAAASEGQAARRKRRWVRPVALAAMSVGFVGSGAGLYALVAPDGGEPAKLTATDGSSGAPILWTPAPPPPPLQPPRADGAPPRSIPPFLLDQNRIPDKTQTVPDAATLAEMASAGVTRVVGVFKLCVDTTGAISELKQLKSTGFPAYDRKIEAELRRERYRPIELDGKITPICTAKTFIYTAPEAAGSSGSDATP
jgi:hypothetical protein